MINRHGKLAWEYWRTYRPHALSDLGEQADQERYFEELGVRVLERIGEVSQDLLEQIPSQDRPLQRTVVRQQATELVYADEVYLAKEPGTEHREL